MVNRLSGVRVAFVVAFLAWALQCVATIAEWNAAQTYRELYLNCHGATVQAESNAKAFLGGTPDPRDRHL